MRGDRILLLSPLTPAELSRQVRESSKSPFYNPLWGGPVMIGKVSELEIQLWVRRPFIRNDFSPRLFLQVHPDPAGTRLDGKFDVGRWPILFMRIWLGFVAFFTVAMLMASIVGDVQGNALLGFAASFGMLAFGIFSPTILYRLSIGDEEKIRDFLRQGLRTQELPAPIEPR